MTTQHRLYELNNAVPVVITPNGKHSGMDITIQNVNSSGHVYVGGEGVTTTNYGYRILPNHAISFELSGADDLYLVADNAEMYAAVIKLRLEQGQ